MDIQKQYDTIWRFFKTTCEYYDDLDWDGEILQVVYKNETIEEYTYSDLKEIIKGFH